MARSEYAKRRLAEIGAAPRSARQPVARAPRARKGVPVEPRLALAYVVGVRSKDWTRDARWFDVDQAFQAGYKAGRSAAEIGEG